MLPIKDNVPTRTFPLVTVSLIAVNVVVWLWEWRSGVNREVLQYGYYPCSLEGPCVSPASTVNHVPWYEGVGLERQIRMLCCVAKSVPISMGEVMVER